MLRKFTVSVLAAFVLALSVTAANAQVICGERAKFLENLSKNHQEAPTSIGMTSTGQILEVLTSAKGSWSIILTKPDGVTCLVATGEAWEPIKRVALGPNA